MMVGKMKKENGKAYCCSKCAKAGDKSKVENKSGDKKSEFFEKMKKETVKKASSNVVVKFTDLSQISAEAVIAAEKSGDERLKQTILDARHQRRQAIASRIEQVQAMDLETQSSKKNSSEAMAVEEYNTPKENVKIASSSEAVEFGFKPVGELTYTEQDAFMKLAMKSGYPKEYVISMITPEIEETEHLKSILEVISNKAMSRESQVAAVTAMIKTSELSQKDLNYLKNYWSNQLGYPAKDWVEALFTSKFYKRIGKK